MFQQARVGWIERLGAERVKQWMEAPRKETEAGLVWRLLFPPPENGYRNARQSAMIVHVSRGARSLLFMGQAGPAVEAAAMAMPVDWNADVLVSGLTATPDALAADWLDRVTPGEVVLSTRAFDRLPFGPAALLDRLHADTNTVIRVIGAEAPWSYEF
jgi:beta-lactamase superfamily II metal-dependent hydrolase